MTKTRREFTPEFKREAVALLESSGRPTMQIATELGISPSMLRNWRALAHGAASRSRAAPTPLPAGSASPADQAAEIARLRRELDRTRMERDVLKKPSRTGSACGVRNSLLVVWCRRGAAVCLLVAHDPVKKHGPWTVARLRVVTPHGDPG